MTGASAESRTQGPTGVARRRQRISDVDTEHRMIRAAIVLVSEQGLTVSLDHLSLEEVIVRADVSRSSAYRRWPYKDLFLADLLVALARATDLSAEPPGLVEELLALIEAADLTAAQARRDLLVEGLRLASTAEFERMSTSPRWQTYLALSATVTGLPAGGVRDAAAAAILDAERRFAARRAHVYGNLATMIGYRPRGNLDPEISFELMASATGAMMTGYIVRSLANPQIATTTRHLAGFGSTEVRDWTAPGYGLTAIVDAFLEPDPDAAWTPDAIARRREFWEQTAASLYER